jgi:hypothetical protein
MDKDTSKSTILVISMGLLVISIAFSWEWALIGSLIVGIIGIISKTLSKIIETLWMQLAGILNYIMPSILLGIVFYIFLFPISLISKLFTKDPLMLSNKYKTTFVSFDKELNKQYFKNSW